MKLRRWLPEPLELRTATHEIGGTLLTLVYVGPNPQGFRVFHADGQYVRGTRQARPVIPTATMSLLRRGRVMDRWIVSVSGPAVLALSMPDRAERLAAPPTSMVRGRLILGPVPSALGHLVRELVQTDRPRVPLRLKAGELRVLPPIAADEEARQHQDNRKTGQQQPRGDVAVQARGIRIW